MSEYKREAESMMELLLDDEERTITQENRKIAIKCAEEILAEAWNRAYEVMEEFVTLKEIEEK
jgi:hypothetical protein